MEVFAIDNNDLKQTNNILIDEKANTAKHGAIIGLILNGTGIFISLMSNSLVAVSDMVNGLIETLSLFMTWLALKRIAKGGSENYNYGHGKLENLASLIIALALVFSFILICKNAITRLLEPTMVNIAGTQAYIVLISICLISNSYFWVRAYRLAGIDPSPAIEGQWRLFRIKAISNLFVISSLSLNIIFRSYSWISYLDPALSLILAAMILNSAYKIFTRTIYDLLDGALEEEIQLKIMRVLALYFNDYLDFLGIRSRRVGSRVFIELFLEFDPESKMSKVQHSIDTIKSSLEESIIGSQVMIIPSRSRV
ncbi:MAG: cation diffusion facilitator family transporter [Syntrophomonas sp.]